MQHKRKPVALLTEGGERFRRAKLLVHTNSESRELILDKPTVLGRMPTYAQRYKENAKTLWTSRLQEFESLWIDEEGKSRKPSNLHVMPSIEAYVARIFDIYDDCNLWLPVIGETEKETNKISRIHVMFMPPDEFNNGWRIVDMISYNGTGLNGRELQPGRKYTLHDRDRIDICWGLIEMEFQLIPEYVGKYHALLVSNPNNQRDQRSRTRKAEKLRDELEKRHFTVKLLSDGVTTREFMEEIMISAGRCGRNTLFWLLYSGNLDRDGSLKFSDGDISKDRLFAELENIRAKKLVAMDGGHPHKFLEDEVPQGVIILSSSAENSPASNPLLGRRDMRFKGVLTEALMGCLQDGRFARRFKVDQTFLEVLRSKGYYATKGQKPDMRRQGKGSTTLPVRTRIITQEPNKHDAFDS